jgi:hypothetical protein
MDGDGISFSLQRYYYFWRYANKFAKYKRKKDNCRKYAKKVRDISPRFHAEQETN